MMSSHNSHQGEREHPLSPCTVSNKRIVIVTGMSGAGKSIALRALEDMNFEAVDNVPLSMIPDLLKIGEEKRAGLALGIDIRNREFDARRFTELLAHIRQHKALHVSVVFLDCDEEILQRRFTETRRKHPIGELISESIRHEREIMLPLREEADTVLDSSHFTPADLRHWFHKHFASPGVPLLSIGILSFSFKHGVPREADLVFDVRFLRNPYYVDSLRPLTGKDEKVGAYIEEDPEFLPFFHRLTELLKPLLPCYQREGKSYLTIAIGCTGGQHRSVFTAEKLSKVLSQEGYHLEVRHLELGK